jgi:hypothetical protein
MFVKYMSMSKMAFQHVNLALTLKKMMTEMSLSKIKTEADARAAVLNQIFLILRRMPREWKRERRISWC